MLRKLLKYEFKATGRLIGVIYLAVLAAAIVTGIIGRFSDATIDNPIAFMIFVAIYAILIVALIVVTILMIIERFYKNMLTGEGYLMHTLPVPTWMHVGAKQSVPLCGKLLQSRFLYYHWFSALCQVESGKRYSVWCIWMKCWRHWHNTGDSSC